MKTTKEVSLQEKTDKTANYILASLSTSVSLYKKKNVAYGDSFRKSLEKFGLVAAIVRMGDKLQRVESLTVDKNRNEVNDESVIDTLTDLAMYSMMLAYEIEEGCFAKLDESSDKKMGDE